MLHLIRKEGIMKKIFVSDLDGTLLDDQKVFHIETINAIQNLRKQGHLFGLATGRPQPSALVAIPNMEEIFDFAIFNNGANVHDFKDKEVKDRFPLDGETIKEIIETYEPLGANPLIFVGKTLHASKEDRYTTYLQKAGLNIVYGKVMDHIQDSHEKIIFSVFDEVKVKAIETAHQNPDPRYHVFLSQDELIEFMDPRINKWVGIEWILDKYNLKQENTITFGDNDNDLPMIEHAHLGVVMSNGSDNAKSLAKEITEYSNNDQGVMRFLEKYQRNE